MSIAIILGTRPEIIKIDLVVLSGTYQYGRIAKRIRELLLLGFR